MTWSYDGASNSNKDYVRFLLGDIEEADQLLQDEDIEFELSQLGITEPLPINREVCIRAALTALSPIIAQMARKVTYTIGPEKVELGKQLENYERLAVHLRGMAKAMHPCAPISVATSPQGYYFSTGLHDNKGGM